MKNFFLNFLRIIRKRRKFVSILFYILSCTLMLAAIANLLTGVLSREVQRPVVSATEVFLSQAHLSISETLKTSQNEFDRLFSRGILQRALVEDITDEQRLELSAHLNDAIALNRFISSFYIINPTTQKVRTNTGEIFTFDEFYDHDILDQSVNVMQTPTPVISPRILDLKIGDSEHTYEYMTFLFQTANESGQPIGSFVVNMDLRKLFEEVTIEASDLTPLSMILRQGTLFTKGTPQVKRISELSSWDPFFSQPVDTVTILNEGGNLFAVCPNATWGFALVSEIPNSAIVDPVYRLQKWILLFIGICMVVLFLVLLLAQKMYSPKLVDKSSSETLPNSVGEDAPIDDLKKDVSPKSVDTSDDKSSSDVKTSAPKTATSETGSALERISSENTSTESDTIAVVDLANADTANATLTKNSTINSTELENSVAKNMEAESDLVTDTTKKLFPMSKSEQDSSLLFSNEDESEKGSESLGTVVADKTPKNLTASADIKLNLVNSAVDELLSNTFDTVAANSNVYAKDDTIEISTDFVKAQLGRVETSTIEFTKLPSSTNPEIGTKEVSETKESVTDGNTTFSDVQTDKMLFQLLNGTFETDEACEEELLFHNINLPNPIYLIAVIQIDNFSKLLTMYDTTDITYYKEQLRKEILVQMKSVCTVVTTDSDFHEVSAILNFSEEGADTASTITKALADACRSIPEQFLFGVSIGVGSSVTELSKLRQSFQHARAAVSYRLIFGAGNLIPYSQIAMRQELAPVYPSQSEKNITQAILCRNLDKTLVEVDNFASKLSVASVDTINMALSQLAIQLTRLVKSLSIPDEKIAELSYQVLSEQLDHCEQLNDKTKVLQNFSKTLIKNATNKEQGEKGKTVDNICLFIRSNCSNPDLGIDTIADYVKLSESHMRVIFKEAMGFSPNEFIIQCRIDAAKHLLATTKQSTKDIALAVGYANHRYFYSVFKNRTGMTATDFRKSLKAQDKEPERKTPVEPDGAVVSDKPKIIEAADDPTDSTSQSEDIYKLT